MPIELYPLQIFLVVFRPIDKGVHPLLASKGFYTLSICKWSTSLVSIEHHCSSQFGCCYVLRLFIEDQQMNAEHVHKCFTLKEVHKYVFN